MNKLIVALSKNYLFIYVFITGAIVLVVEILALRILSPYFGNTLYSTSSVISVVLGALSLGYYVGGKLADKYRSRSLFFLLIVLGGLLIEFAQLVSIFLLPSISNSYDIAGGPLVASMILFFIPSLILGTLSPYAVSLSKSVHKKSGVGSVAGNIFFFSTLGSIFGSLLTAFFLIPNFGVSDIMIGSGVLLVLIGGIPLLLGSAIRFIRFLPVYIVSILLIIGSLLLNHLMNQQYVYIKDGVYTRIAIVDSNDARYLMLDKNFSSAIDLQTHKIIFDYTKYYALYKLLDINIKNALFIGGGSYTMPKALEVEKPNALIEVSEIEPELFDISKKFFSLPRDTKVLSYTEDGRRFLRKSPTKYDYIFSDVYYSLYSVPTHFTTKEFFELAKNRLADDGIFIANLIGSLSNDQSFVMSEILTFNSVFPNSYTFAVNDPNSFDSQNIILLGLNSANTLPPSKFTNESLTQAGLGFVSGKLIDTDQFDISHQKLLTDNYAPVDYLILNDLDKSF